MKPAALDAAELVDDVLAHWPGYTRDTLMREDAHWLLQTRGLLDPDCGKADDGEDTDST